MSEAKFDVPIEPSEQPVDVASDDVPPIPNDSGLVPGEERI
jgi:hypothetical protein